MLGESITSLHYQFRLGKSTIHCFIPEVCSAIYTVLRDQFVTVSGYQREIFAEATAVDKLNLKRLQKYFILVHNAK